MRTKVQVRRLLIAIRLVAASVAATCLGLGLGACSGGDSTLRVPHRDTARFPYVPPKTEPVDAYRHVDGDRDNDFGGPDVEPRGGALLKGGRTAGARDGTAIATLVRRYYAAALSADGARACALLYSTFAEAVAQNYGEPGGPQYLRGVRTCPTAATGVFRHYHAALAAEVPRLRVLRVLVRGRHGVALLGFGALERELLVSREGRVWRVTVLRDRELP